MPLIRRALPLALAAALVLPAAAFAQARPAAAPPASTAQAGSPSQLVLGNTERVLKTLESRRAEFTRDRGALQTFINSEFNTVFDRDYAARQVLGRHGRGASDADVKAFGDALAENLMRKYGSSLLDFNTQLRVRIKSEAPLPRGLGVRVSSELLRSGGEPIPVDYLMRQSGGTWKVFDVMVEGVSFVRTFREQFDTPLQRKSIQEVARDLRSGQIQATAE
ncbi:MlaC/ttg2D family ABC transporter substrate-binding protein [Luteimonas fraxinea]|uniref:MlaC/ttg2D family ABC transporter substrate-binding protein n=1 Tax=Luteimonas fraxinea TaxID=2901869 RepID=UPI001E2F31AD|nr:ABC transporter substrate-binding protein [Luteimonas fraxinea]MCD9125072.1 ABC transporter substrate-binding protein [Luteimonas fraxinea]